MGYRTFGYEGEKLIAYFYFQDWTFLNLGLHVGLEAPNIEIHVPFGFFRIGWRGGDFIPLRPGWKWNVSMEDVFLTTEDEERCAECDCEDGGKDCSWIAEAE